MEWKSFLTKVSETLAQSDDLHGGLKVENVDWLGFEGISNPQIQMHEERLKTNLPPSYKEFLKVTNGFKQLNCFVWDILPIEKIDWLKRFDPTLYDLYTTEYKDTFNAADDEYFVYGDEQKTTNFRSDFLANSLAISNWGDATILLLNPFVKFGDEWEAWVFATWHLGPVRYRSFQELMEQEYISYLELLNERE